MALAFEIADGWLPLYFPPSRADLYDLPAVPDGFEIAVNVSVFVDDDVATALWPVKATLGFYIGGMGAKGRNFHTELMARMGFEKEASRSRTSSSRASGTRPSPPSPTTSPTRSACAARRSGSPSGSRPGRPAP